jgi:hypothetical protein
MACQRSIHSLTVIAPAPGSIHVPARTFASWSRPQVSAACLVSKPDWLASPPGILYLTLPVPKTSSAQVGAVVGGSGDVLVGWHQVGFFPEDLSAAA